MNTDKAFAEMINLRGIHHELSISAENVRTMRYKLKHNKPIKFETKVELLKKAGYELVQEPKWKRG